MKKILALLIASALILSLAACAASGRNDTAGADDETDHTETEAPAEAPQAGEAAEEAAGLPGTVEAAGEAAGTQETGPEDDAAAAEALKETILGDWVYPGGGYELEHLTFNADGTGTYTGLEDRQYSFTYDVMLDHRTYGNGEAYTENMLRMAYDTGETEDIIFFFNDSGQMVFHDSENGGYTGVMYCIDVFIKE